MSISLLFALVVGEIILRISTVASPITYLPNSLYGWSNTPNDEFTRVFEGRSIDIKINSHGLRDYEYSYESDPGVQTILVLGDSFSEAMQVPLEASFPKLIEGELNSLGFAAHRGSRVINTGTSGFGTDNELLFLVNEGFKYEPDIVLVALYIGNDIRNNWYPLENVDAGGFKKPYFTPGEGSLQLNAFPFEKHDSAVTKLKVFLNRNLHLYALLREVVNRQRDRQVREKDTSPGIGLDTMLFAEDYPNDWETAWFVTKEIIAELNEEARELGAELFIAIIPTQQQVHEKYWLQQLERIEAMQEMSWDLEKPNRILTDFLSAEGIAHIDLLPEFRERSESSGQLYYLEGNGHWNELGHALGAELITARLVRLIESQD